MAKAKDWQAEGKKFAADAGAGRRKLAEQDEEGRRVRERFDRAAETEAERVPKRLKALEEEKQRILASSREEVRRGVHGDTFKTERGLSQQDRSRLAEIERLLNAPSEVKSWRETIGRLEREQAGLRKELEVERGAAAKAEKQIAEKKPEAKKSSVSPFTARQLNAQLDYAKRELECMEARRSLGDRFLGLFGKKPALEVGAMKAIEELEAKMKAAETETLTAKSEETDRIIRRGAETRIDALRARLADVNERLERARKDLEYQESILKKL